MAFRAVNEKRATCVTHCAQSSYLNALKQLAAPIALCVFLAFSAQCLAEPGVPKGYRLSVGDKIAVSIFGHRELSSEGNIDDQGNIQMLPIGTIKVQGKTIDEVRMEVVSKLADGFLKAPIVSVKISELRPVYILGDVRRPGSYPFRFQMTVKSMIAVAGGLGTIPVEGPSILPDYLTSEERVRSLRQNLQLLTLRLARLEAQIDGNENFDPPAPQSGDADLSASLASERATLQAQSQALKEQLELLKAQKPRLEKQIEALKGQLETQNKQIQLSREQVDRYEDLTAKGLGRNSTMVDYKQALTRFESEKWRIIAELSRLEMDVGDLDYRAQEAELAYRRKAIEEMQIVRERLSEVKVALPIAAEIRKTRLAQVGGALLEGRTLTIAITRATGGSRKVLQADDQAEVQPGDIIDVRLGNNAPPPVSTQ